MNKTFLLKIYSSDRLVYQLKNMRTKFFPKSMFYKKKKFKSKFDLIDVGKRKILVASCK